LSILTFIAVIPPVVERTPLETAFVYGTPSTTPLIDSIAYFVFFVSLFFVSIVASIAVFRQQRWAWFLAIALHMAVFAFHLAASISIGRDSNDLGFIGSFDGSAGKYASMLISLVSLYLLSRKDVRTFLTVIN